MRERLGASEAEVERVVDDEAPATEMKINASTFAAGKGKKAGKKNKSQQEEGEWLEVVQVGARWAG